MKIREIAVSAKKLVKIISQIVVVVLIMPSVSFSSPRAVEKILMTYFFTLLCIQFALFWFILLSKKFAGLRLPLLGIYVLNIFIIWLWVRKHYPLSTILLDTLVIAGIPILLFVLLLWVALQKNKHV